MMRRIWNIVGVMVLATWALYIFAVLSFSLTAETTLYQLFMNNRIFAPMVLFTLALFIASLLVEMRVAAALLMCSVFCTCGAYGAHFFQSGVFKIEQEVDSMRFGDHVYHLVWWIPDYAESSNYYRLYECDSLDLLCHETGIISNFELEMDNGIKHVDTVALAVVDDTVKIEINGQIIDFCCRSDTR